MDYTIKSFQEIIPSAESDLPAGVKLCSGSLFLSLSLHSTRPAGLNSIVVIDTRFPSSSPPALLNARRLWPDGTTRIGSSERKRIRSLLKNVINLYLDLSEDLFTLFPLMIIRCATYGLFFYSEPPPARSRSLETASFTWR